MSRNVKVALYIVLPITASLCLCCIAAVILIPRAASNAVAVDPAQAARIGAEIADYAPPAGYQTAMGMDVLAYQFVELESEDRRAPGIMLAQFKTTNVSREQMAQQMRQSFSSQFQRSAANMHFVGDRPVTIKGQPTQLSVSEGSVGANTMRQAVGVFDGKGGVAMVMIMGDADRWDWTVFDRFCESIR